MGDVERLQLGCSEMYLIGVLRLMAREGRAEDIAPVWRKSVAQIYGDTAGLGRAEGSGGGGASASQRLVAVCMCVELGVSMRVASCLCVHGLESWSFWCVGLALVAGVDLFQLCESWRVFGVAPACAGCNDGTFWQRIHLTHTGGEKGC